MHRLIALFFILITLCLSGTAEAKLRVVATTADLASVAKEVGGDRVDVMAIALPTQDPHFVDARPHLALELAKADLLLSVGLGLEVGWLPTLLTSSRNGRIQSGAPGNLECSQFVKLLDVPATKVDRSQGDIHPAGNPHYMFDPRQAARVAKGIAERLAQLDPSGRDAYKRQAIEFIRKLGAATKGWQKQLARAQGAKVIAYHRSFPYLADWIGMSIVEHIEPKPGIPPNPRHVAHVIDVVKQNGVRAILQESFYPGKTSELIAERTHIKLVRLPGAPDYQNGQSYIAHMNRIVELLAGACSP
jgi:zinc/manganese transport system substrate-binding protein